ncbi:MAG TPA: tripartite tricarboxylate transporter substrate-binding protein [Candidatus Binatia bacterium]|nr:tripartite tricarboxylate transporter substrate-binding protein [Candidatus Binatia bacterium]
MRRKKYFIIIFLSCAVSWAACGTRSVTAQAEPFYKGKTIRLIVGLSPGGFYDRWARLFARFMPLYIPGNPSFIVQNMPGAGSMIAMNHVFGVAKPDGLTLVMPNYGVYLDQLAGREEVRFDITKGYFIGSPEKSDIILYARADAPFKTVQDMRKLAEPAKCGATGTAGADYLIAKVLNDTLGVKINTVIGYAGGSEIDIAVEKGEVQCRGMTIAPHFGREPFNSWHKKGFDQHILQTSEKRDSRVGDVPTIYEIFEKENTADESRRVADVILRGGDFGRPMIAAPGTPVDRVNILREAYVQSMNNAELLAEAKKGRMDIEPVTGEQLQALAKRVMSQPPAVLKRVKKILE